MASGRVRGSASITTRGRRRVRVTDEGTALVSGSTGTTGHAARYTLRSLAVFLLLLGLAGATNQAAHVDGEQVESSARVEALAHQREVVELRRLVSATESTDRSRRSSEPTGPERVSRGDEVRSKPAPEPSAAPAPADSAPSAPAGPVPDSCSDYSGNRATGCTLLLDAGFSLDQMSCLDNLWTKESGWNHRAQNPSSGAYGVPQALPGDKMASHGSDWRTNPATQIRWGLGYIANRYSTPCGAWQFFQNNNWY